MIMTDHLRLVMTIDGIYQAKLSNASVNGESGAQAVRTLEGLAGKTDTGGELEISGTWAVELAGMEFDVFTALADGTYHEIQIVVGDKSIFSKGWWQSAGISQSANASTEATGSFKGDLRRPE
jgi:hypothetical protein